MVRRSRGGRWLLLLAAVLAAFGAASTATRARPAVTTAAAHRPPATAHSETSVPGDRGLPSAQPLVAHGRLAASVPVRRPAPARTGVPPVAITGGWSGAGVAPLSLASGWSAAVVPLRVGTQRRSYLLVRPRPVSGARLPVVVVLAGRGLAPARMVRLSDLPGVTGPAILVYPAGYGGSWNAGACCGAAQAAGINDIAFLNAVIHHVVASQPDAATGQTYVVGYSNGGRMAYRMACAAPGLFAGMAAVEAVPVASCSHLVPLRISIVASTGDPLLTIRHGAAPKVIHRYVEPTVDDVVARWRTLDGCYGLPVVAVEGRATIRTWTHCRGRGQVQYTTYAGGSHAWPTGKGATPSAQLQVWRFLDRRSSPAPAPGRALGSSAR